MSGRLCSWLYLEVKLDRLGWICIGQRKLRKAEPRVPDSFPRTVLSWCGTQGTFRPGFAAVFFLHLEGWCSDWSGVLVMSASIPWSKLTPVMGPIKMVPADGMLWGCSVTSMVLETETHSLQLITRKHWESQIEGLSTKQLIYILQKYQGHKGQGETKECSRVRKTERRDLQRQHVTLDWTLWP